MLSFKSEITFWFHWGKVTTHQGNLKKKIVAKNHYFNLVLENIYRVTDALHNIPFTASFIVGRNIFYERNKLLKFNLGEFLTEYHNISGNRIDKPQK